MNISVTGCNDCPFKMNGGWEGEIKFCGIDEQRRDLKFTKKYFPEVDTPDWCPIAKQSATVAFISK